MELIINIKIIKQKDNNIKNNLKYYGDFLYEHLGDFRDDLDSIKECFEYLLKDTGGGGLYEAQDEQDNCLGIVVILKTHMNKFLPSNFLVYIAVTKETRGKGVGGMLLDYIQNDLKGSICLHVEPDNPAINLYKRKGFTNKYLEMRYDS